MKKIILSLMILSLLIFISGCAQEEKKKDAELQENEENREAEIIGPNGCKTDKECGDYCSKKPFECKVWCEVNREFCEKRNIRIDIPPGIPGSPCTGDQECMTKLCLDFKCEIPSPDNMAKKSGFKLPGNCGSMIECAKYCADPKNSEACLTFCENFPSLCEDTSSIRASVAPEECKECTTCNSKECILDCTYRCFQYMPIKTTSEQEINTMKQETVLERKYQEPIKAVWEPGPAYNRIGITYFTDEYKDIGINTYSITPKYNHKEGKLTHSVDHATGEKADNEKISNIIKTKKAGMQVVLVAHDLYDMFPDVSGKTGGINFNEYYDDIEATALKWAKIAEEYKVEYFAPVNEFEYVLYQNGYSAEEACKITNELYDKIIPKVRETFKGKIYCRVGGMEGKFGCMDFSKCDIFGFTYGFEGGNYKQNFEEAFKTGEELAKKYEKKYIMAEAFMLLTQGTMSECIDLHKAGIKAYKEVAKNGMGYTFMGLIQRDPINKNDCPIKDTELVQDYKKFFAEME